MSNMENPDTPQAITITQIFHINDVAAEPDLLLQLKVRKLLQTSSVSPNTIRGILEYEADRLEGKV